MQIRDLK